MTNNILKYTMYSSFILYFYCFCGCKVPLNGIYSDPDKAHNIAIYDNGYYSYISTTHPAGLNYMTSNGNWYEVNDTLILIDQYIFNPFKGYISENVISREYDTIVIDDICTKSNHIGYETWYNGEKLFRSTRQLDSLKLDSFRLCYFNWKSSNSDTLRSITFIKSRQVSTRFNVSVKKPNLASYYILNDTLVKHGNVYISISDKTFKIAQVNRIRK